MPAPNTWAVTVGTAGLVLVLAALYGQALSAGRNQGLGPLLVIGLVLFGVGILLFWAVDPETVEIV